MRPANLAVEVGIPLRRDVELMTAQPEDRGAWRPALGPDRVVGTGERPAGQLGRLTPDGPEALAPGFELSAAVLRHLQADPLLPDELLPGGWPGAPLRGAYDLWDARYRSTLREWSRSG